MSPIEVWGPAVWTLFHTMAEKVSEQSYPIIANQLFSQIVKICKVLPCPDCASDASNFLAKINIVNLKTKTSLKNMIYLFHNYVNVKKRKPLFNYENINIYKNYPIIPVLNNFNAKFNTKGNMNLISESFQRNLVQSEFKKWIVSNLVAFLPRAQITQEPSVITEEPVVEVVEEPVVEVIEKPVTEVIEEPVAVVEEPIVEVVEEPVVEVVEEPVAVVEEPVVEVVEEPIVEVVEEPIVEVVEEHVTEIVEEHVTEIVEEPVTEVIEEPIVEVIEEPVEVVEEPVAVVEEPIVEVVEEPVEVVEEPVTEVIEEPVTEVIEEHVTEVIEEPIVEVVEEPVVEVVEQNLLNHVKERGRRGRRRVL